MSYTKTYIHIYSKKKKKTLFLNIFGKFGPNFYFSTLVLKNTYKFEKKYIF